jgi:hypothetical protein
MVIIPNPQFLASSERWMKLIRIIDRINKMDRMKGRRFKLLSPAFCS